MTLDHTTENRRRPTRNLFRRLLARRDGATAIEFTILSLPFLAIVFASLETFMAFSAEQVLASATDTMARRIRTGEITFNLGRTSDMNAAQFRKAFCDEIAIMMPCSSAELATPSKLFIDVRTFSKFSDIPKSIPLNGTDLDTSSFRFTPGGKKSINIVRAYYRWNIFTDLVRPYLSNIKASNGSNQSYLMVATAVIQSEDYP